MAFTLQIKKKGLFGSKQIDMEKLLNKCCLKYGSDNEFYVLQEGERNGESVILYNPSRIGRGIYFNADTSGVLEVSYNIPTTAAEISDFIKVVQEIADQLKKVEIYCVEEEREYTVSQLAENQQSMVEFSLDSLHGFCRNDFELYMLTLAMWPIAMDKGQVEKFTDCRDLAEFEQMLHDMQNMDVYYANPVLMRNKSDGKILAVYTLTEECESIFPKAADGFLNLEDIKIDEGFVRFYIYSEQRFMDGMYSYDKFISCMMEHGAKPYDAAHVLLPSVTKKEIEEVVQEIG